MSEVTTTKEEIAVSASAESKPVLHAHNLTKVYKTGEVEVKALDGVDFEVYEHEMVVLLESIGHPQALRSDLNRKMKSFPLPQENGKI